MNKIFQLYRLNYSNKILIFKYLFKRILSLKTTDKEKQINEYYYNLIVYNGYLKEENEAFFISYFPKFDMTIKLRKRPSSDLNVFSQIFKEQEYKPVVDVYLEKFKKKNNLTIIDAGSNIGLTTVYLNSKFKNSKFIVIEPDSSNFDTMAFNIEINGIKNVEKIEGGIWSKNTNLQIIKDFRDQKDWSFRVEETNKESALKAFSIQYIIEKQNIEVVDILKIDIEGSEKEVFTNPDSDITFLSKTRCIALEIHDEFNCREEIYAILNKYNFEFFNSGELTIGINKNLLD